MSAQDYEPAWTTVHNAHLQRRRMRAEQGGVQVVGQVVELDSRGGRETFTVLSDGGTSVPFSFEDVTVVFVGDENP